MAFVVILLKKKKNLTTILINLGFPQVPISGTTVRGHWQSVDAFDVCQNRRRRCCVDETRACTRPSIIRRLITEFHFTRWPTQGNFPGIPWRREPCCREISSIHLGLRFLLLAVVSRRCDGYEAKWINEVSPARKTAVCDCFPRF